MLKNFIQKNFNKKILIKTVILFTIGLSTRTFINHYYNINVFTDCFNGISIVYYLLLSYLIMFINNIFGDTNFISAFFDKNLKFKNYMALSIKDENIKDEHEELKPMPNSVSADINNTNFEDFINKRNQYLNLTQDEIDYYKAEMIKNLNQQRSIPRALREVLPEDLKKSYIEFIEQRRRDE